MFEMPKYLVKGNYVGEGITGLMNEGGTKRRKAADAALASVGGTIECFYYAFGNTDLFAIVDAPDASAAAAASLRINASGAVRVTLTPLLTAAEMDAAAGMEVSYSAPGA